MANTPAELIQWFLTLDDEQLRKLPREQLEEILKLLDELEREKKFNALSQFKPYPKQLEFLNLGSSKLERLLMAGNRVGKCISYRTRVPHPDGTSTEAGVLFERGQPFDVISWDGRDPVAARVSALVKKPAEPLVRIWLSSGRSFECALNHRVLTRDGGWRFVAPLLVSVPCLPASNSGSGLSTRAQDALHWFGRFAGLVYRYCRDFRLRDAQPQTSVAVSRDALTSSSGAQPHNRQQLHSGAQEPTHTNSAQPCSVRPSNLYAQVRYAVRSAVFLSRNSCRSAQYSSPIRQGVRQLSIAVQVLLRSIDAILRRKYVSVALASPIEGNHIIAYEPIGSQEVYDFTVPIFHNYMAAGVVHHNTYTGAAEMAYHLTGRYPDWWRGRKFNRPIKAWASNDTGLNTRDIVQTKLCGPYGVVALQGSGAIPRDAVNWDEDVSLSKGVSDAYDTVQVKHVSGGVSILTFKSYEQGRKKWQGEAVDVIWFDEEPAPEIYSEGLARLAPVRSGEQRGIAYMTFTPLEGRTEIVLRFLDQEHLDRAVVYMTIEDAEHIDAKERAQTIAAYRPHERQARAMGVPLLGSGLVFDIDEMIIKEEPIRSLPNHWPKLWGIDFGIGHPFAAVLGVWDRDFDVLHIIHAFRMRDTRPIDHARAMRPYGDIPVAYPRDGAVRDKGSGIALAKLYKDEGLRMLHDHATWPDGSISTEAGIEEMYARMTTGRFKVASHLGDWWEEFRTYHRKDGQLVKINDDLMSATRHLVMMKRFAQVGGRMLRADPNRAAAVARDVDLDLFA